jgi:hypothetical protein
MMRNDRRLYSRRLLPGMPPFPQLKNVHRKNSIGVPTAEISHCPSIYSPSLWFNPCKGSAILRRPETRVQVSYEVFNNRTSDQKGI